MITQQPLCAALVDGVFEDMHPIWQSELANFGMDIRDVRQMFLDRIGKPLSFGFLSDGAPLACLYSIVYRDIPARLWFIGSKLFDQSWFSLARQLRLMLPYWAAAAEEPRVQVWSRSDHPQAGRWLKIIGFTRQDHGIWEVSYGRRPES